MPLSDNYTQTAWSVDLRIAVNVNGYNIGDANINIF